MTHSVSDHIYQVTFSVYSGHSNVKKKNWNNLINHMNSGDLVNRIDFNFQQIEIDLKLTTREKNKVCISLHHVFSVFYIILPSYLLSLLSVEIILFCGSKSKKAL